MSALARKKTLCSGRVLRRESEGLPFRSFMCVRLRLPSKPPLQQPTINPLPRFVLERDDPLTSKQYSIFLAHDFLCKKPE